VTARNAGDGVIVRETRAGATVALPVALALLLSLTSLAGGDEAGPLSVNLDGDPTLERVVGQQLCESSDGSLGLPQPSCPEDQFLRRRVVIEDTCDGKPYTRDISSVQDTVDRLRVINADGATRRPEIFFDMRSGATGRGGDVRLVRYDPTDGSCWQPHRLFRYPTRATLGRIPRGAEGRIGFSPFLGNFSKRFGGREIRMIETYVDRDDAFCCPSFRRVTYFRFRFGTDRYVRYRTRVSRIKKR
jgi:hypothetical protein